MQLKKICKVGAYWGNEVKLHYVVLFGSNKVDGLFSVSQLESTEHDAYIVYPG